MNLKIEVREIKSKSREIIPKPGSPLHKWLTGYFVYWDNLRKELDNSLKRNVAVPYDGSLIKRRYWKKVRDAI